MVPHWTEFDRGGHFAVTEEPDFHIDDVRNFTHAVERRSNHLVAHGGMARLRNPDHGLGRLVAVPRIAGARGA